MRPLPPLRAASRLLAVGLLAGPLALSLGSCGDDDGDGAPDQNSIELVDAETEVLAIDNVFDPEDLVIEAGTTVVFRNAGRNDHNVIPEDESASWRIDTEDFAPTDEASHRFTEPGEYRYYCSIHGTVDVGMIGTITVTEPGDT